MTTRNIIPRVDGEGSIGVTGTRWGDLYTDAGTITALETTSYDPNGSITGFSSNTEIYGDTTTRAVVACTLAQMVKVPFDAGQNAPVSGDTLDSSDGRKLKVIHIVVTGGSWVGNDAAGVFWCLPLDDTGVPTTVSYYSPAKPLSNNDTLTNSAIPTATINGTCTGGWQIDPDYERINTPNLFTQSSSSATATHGLSGTAVLVSTAQVSKSGSSVTTFNITPSITQVALYGYSGASNINYLTISNCSNNGRIFIYCLFSV